MFLNCIELLSFGIGHNYTWCFGIYRSYFAGIIVFFYVYSDSYYFLTKKRPIDIIKFNQ